MSDTFYGIEIELLCFKLCPVLFRQSFSKLSSDCSSEWKNESPKQVFYEQKMHHKVFESLCRSDGGFP